MGEPEPGTGESSIVATDATKQTPPDASPTTWRDLGLGGRSLVAVLLSLAALHLARDLLIPIVFSILASLAAAPVVRGLMRIHLPRALAVLLVTGGAISLVAGVVTLLDDPLGEWLGRAPSALTRIEAKLKDLRRPLQAASKATEQLMNLGEAQAKGQATVRVVGAESGALSSMLRGAPAILASVVAAAFLTVLMLLHGDNLLPKFTALIAREESRQEFVAGTHAVQQKLSRYLLTVTLINAGLGALTGGALALIGFPDPLLWAGVVMLANYAAFVGPLVTAVLLLVSGFAVPNAGLGALLAPGIYLGLHLVESQLVTPLLVGRQLELDPVVILLALMLFGWLWGVFGLLMAVPLLACFKVVAERLPGAEPWAHLLGR